MEKINQDRLEGIKDLIKKVYEGNDNYRNKISVLMNTRRKNHNNKEIQDLCNFYLTKLYDEKFNDLKKNNKIDESKHSSELVEDDMWGLVKGPKEEDLNKKKRKNLYVNPNAGDVEHNINFFNQCTDVGNVADAGQALGEKKERINIKESLIKLDNEDYKGYYDMYINANLDLNQKQELANLLAANKINESYNYLLKRQK